MRGYGCVFLTHSSDPDPDLDLDLDLDVDLAPDPTPTLALSPTCSRSISCSYFDCWLCDDTSLIRVDRRPSSDPLPDLLLDPSDPFGRLDALGVAAAAAVAAVEVLPRGELRTGPPSLPLRRIRLALPLIPARRIPSFPLRRRWGV